MSDYGDFLRSEYKRQDRSCISDNFINAHSSIEQVMLDKKICAINKLSASIDCLASTIKEYKPPVFINIIIDKNTSSDELKKLLESLR